MKICQTCNQRYEEKNWECPSCHSKPQTRDSYITFAPELAEINDGFKPEYFDNLANLEEKNFWFRARNRLIFWVLRKYFSNAASFFEIGCGTGFVLSGIKKNFGHLSLSGSEIYLYGLQYAAKRLGNGNLFQMDARNIPFENEFDVIGAFDVLEHIKDDLGVLQQMYNAVKSGGGIIITVPQHKFLWSQMDDYACHVRRYQANELKLKVQEAGFKVIKQTSFVSLLFPLMYLSRLKMRFSRITISVTGELEQGKLVNYFLEKILGLERVLISWGIRFTFGGSLIIIARKDR